MNVGLYRTTGALETAQQQLDLVSTNLANVNTPGFKRHLSLVETQSVGAPGTGQTGVGARERIDFSQGTLERTGAALDLALEGEGFFEVEGPNGPLYTRNGRFHLDSRGVLVTGEGYPVAWEASTASIDAAGEAVLVAPDGTVSQGLNRLGKLSLVAFPAQDRLQLTRDGFFHADAALTRTPAEASVHQGALESSNSDGVTELVSMVTVQRSHEMAANVQRMIDQSYRRLHQAR